MVTATATTYELKQIEHMPVLNPVPGGPEKYATGVTVLMEHHDADYLDRRAECLRRAETDPMTEYRVIARF